MGRMRPSEVIELRPEIDLWAQSRYGKRASAHLAISARKHKTGAATIEVSLPMPVFDAFRGDRDILRVNLHYDPNINTMTIKRQREGWRMSKRSNVSAAVRVRLPPGIPFKFTNKSSVKVDDWRVEEDFLRFDWPWK